MPNTHVPAAGEAMPAAHLNRRLALLGGLTAAAALAAMPKAHAAGDPDAELIRLEAEFNAARDTFEAAFDRKSELEARLFARRPPEPVEMEMPDELKKAYGALTVDELVTGDHPARIATHAFYAQKQERRAAWQADCDEIERSCGLAEAQAEQDRLCDAVGDIVEAILGTPATTVSGLLIKLRVAEKWSADAADALVVDLKTMAGAS